jgi:hypothetical protein
VTIKVHRRRLLEKMQADSIADVFRMGADLQIAPACKVRERSDHRSPREAVAFTRFDRYSGNQACDS